MYAPRRQRLDVNVKPCNLYFWNVSLCFFSRDQYDHMCICKIGLAKFSVLNNCILRISIWFICVLIQNTHVHTFWQKKPAVETESWDGASSISIKSYQLSVRSAGFTDRDHLQNHLHEIKLFYSSQNRLEIIWSTDKRSVALTVGSPVLSSHLVYKITQNIIVCTSIEVEDEFVDLCLKFLKTTL